MVRSCMAVVGVLVLACCASAYGQDARAQANAYLATPAYDHGKMAALQSQVARLMPKQCRAELHRSAVMRSPDLRFGAGGTPSAGWIRVSYDTVSCDAPRTFNVWVLGQASGAPRFVAGVPGSSKADLVLQGDAMRWFRTALEAAPFVPPGCKDVRLLDTRFEAFTGKAAATSRDAVRPWRETWHAYACGKVGDVEMRFTPDATGVTIAATAKD